MFWVCFLLCNCCIVAWVTKSITAIRITVLFSLLFSFCFFLRLWNLKRTQRTNFLSFTHIFGTFKAVFICYSHHSSDLIGWIGCVHLTDYNNCLWWLTGSCVYLSVSLFVCEQNNFRIIFKKFLENVKNGPKKRWLNVGDVPDSKGWLSMDYYCQITIFSEVI